MRSWLRLAGVLAGCFGVGLGLAWLLFVIWLHAPASHVEEALWYLVTSGIISLCAGLLAMIAVGRWVPSLWLKIAVAAAVGSVAAIVNVLYMPLLMFAETADKDILVITMVYFLALSVAFAFLVAWLAGRQLGALREGAIRLAEGALGTQVEVQGADELADLARAFNRMSFQLKESFARERHLEQERRDLLVAVSHDLRTPLASIRAMVEAINDGVVTEPQTVRRYLEIVQGETEHLGRLIDDLFELARIESGSLELRLSAVPLDALVAEAVDGLRIQAEEKGIQLRAECQENLPALTLDGPRIQRVVLNLIENALRHTPPGGRVDVEVARDNGHVTLAVSDTGEGIATEDQSLVFERFYRGEKSRSRESGGAGLGLAIARGIVEAHDGTIQLESSKGRGARFVVTLKKKATGTDAE
jgi:signal transduction histidine kinase